MTDHPFNNHPEPSKPEPSKPERAGRDVPRGAYNPITLDDLQNPGESPIELLVGPLDTNVTRCLGAILFVLIFAFSRRFLPVAPIIIVVLLGGLLYRMSKREQLIAGAPLTFAGVRLAMLLTERFFLWDSSAYSTQGLVRANDMGLPWMPLFLSVCLFYMPVKGTYTSKVIFWDSTILLLSGLLPGEGYTVVFALILFTLFLSIGIALACDLLPLPKLLQPASTPAPTAHPLQA